MHSRDVLCAQTPYALVARQRDAKPPKPVRQPWLASPWLPPGPPPGADRTLAVAHGHLCGTKPLRAPRLDKECPTRGLSTALDDPSCVDLQEMPINHGKESLKLAARVIRCPTIYQLGEDPQEMGIHHFAPNVAGIRPPVLGAVQRRRPADVDPWLIPDRWDDQPWPAVCVGRLRELQGA